MTLEQYSKGYYTPTRGTSIRISISLAHCITQKNQLFTSAQPLGSRSPVLIHMHAHSTDFLSHCITHEIHLVFLINSLLRGG
jgi:hypothetical protein